MGIYLHIPFCVRKCNYCDFLSAPADAAVRRAYVSCLEEEIRQFEDADQYRVVSVFFGGGTPSILEGEEIGGIMKLLQEKFDFSASVKSRERKHEQNTEGRIETDGKAVRERRCLKPEITIECNPGTLTEQKLKIYRECGINRLSLGLQSADNKELNLLGRIHTWEDFLENYKQARQMGFDNINVDLMSSLPGQTAASWENTLRKVLKLRPEHISAYSLIIEEGTPFYEIYGEAAASREQGKECGLLPEEEEEREMYYATKRILEEAGLYRYEISNYALPGRESVHNSGYWRRREYAGFGLGASSQLKRLRYKNTDNLEEYLQGDFSKKELLVLTKDNEIEETMYLGLRMTGGIDLREFEDTFGVSAETIYRKELEQLDRQGLICRQAEKLCLTDRGMDLSNRVLAEFLLD